MLSPACGQKPFENELSVLLREQKIGFFRNGKRRMLVVRFRAVVYLNLPGIPERALQTVSFPAPDPDTLCKYR